MLKIWSESVESCLTKLWWDIEVEKKGEKLTKNNTEKTKRKQKGFYEAPFYYLFYGNV